MRWYHSLYWRIAIGVVVALALLLVVQAILFVWVIARTGATPNQPPDRVAQAVAADVAQALERDPSIDVVAYVRQEYAREAQPFAVVLADGRVVEIGGPFPDALVADARTRLQMRLREGPSPFARGAGPFGRGDRGGGPGSRARPAPVVVAGRVQGLVVAPPQPPFRFLLARYGPTLALVSIATLIVGALVAAVAVFGPARRRLRGVEAAARRLGEGDLAARAPTEGNDEVAAVAAAFNTMATELAARAVALAAADRTRRQLLADVSHELATPVTAMRGYLETLTMEGFALDDATRARYLRIVSDETARLERIIRDLLELARFDDGGGSFTPGEVAVAQLFARVRARHERTAAEHGVSIAAMVDAGADHVRGDEGRLEQALQNLAANALRYAPPGTAIELRARRVEAGVALSVSDEGAGIAPEHLPRVFDRFYKAEESRTPRQGAGAASGSGLGLSIVKAIAERHGAHVSVRSEPGQTTFEIAPL